VLFSGTLIAGTITQVLNGVKQLSQKPSGDKTEKTGLRSPPGTVYTCY